MKRKTSARRAPAEHFNSSDTGTPIELFNGSLDQLIGRIFEISKALEPASKIMYNDTFHGNIQNTDHAKTMLLNGCPVLMEKYLKKAQSLKVKPAQNFSPVYMPACEGLFFSVPAYLEGMPEHWINLEQAPATGVIKDLYVNIAAGQMIDESKIFEKLISIVKYIDEQESAGTRLNVYLICNLKPSGDNPNRQPVSLTVKIKNDSEPVNLQQIVYLVASPVFLRFVFLFFTANHCKGFAHFGAYTSDQETENQNIKRTDIVFIPSFYYDSRNSIYDYSNITEVYPHLID